MSANTIEENVMYALNNPNWDFRTSKGIARELELAENVVSQILKNNREYVRKCIIPTQTSEVRYAPASRSKKIREYVAEIHYFIALRFPAKISV